MCSCNAPKSTPDGLAWVMRGMIHLYRVTLSPVFYAFGVRCRHEPTCSAYGLEALRIHGAWRGGWMTLGRLLRCRPLGTSGYDPVPREHSSAPWWSVWRFRQPYRGQDTD